jgi:beta-N-acetylhexosaminidase
MDMGGLAAHFPPGEAAVRTIEAGCDVVLKSADTDAAVRALLDAVRTGRLGERRLDESVRRVLVEKAWLGLLDDRMPRTAELHATISSPAHLALEEEVARRALTLLREEPGLLPLGGGRRLASIAVTDETLLPNLGGVLASELARRTAETPAVSLKLDPRSGEEEIAAALKAAGEADVVILGLFIRPRAGAGKLQIPPQGKRVVDALLATGKTTVVVSFGSPYLLRDYPAWPTYLCAYGVQDVVQKAVVAALFGEAALGGKLPVTLPGLYPRGSGLQKPASRPPS